MPMYYRSHFFPDTVYSPITPAFTLGSKPIFLTSPSHLDCWYLHGLLTAFQTSYAYKFILFYFVIITFSF